MSGNVSYPSVPPHSLLSQEPDHRPVCSSESLQDEDNASRAKKKKQNKKLDERTSVLNHHMNRDPACPLFRAECLRASPFYLKPYPFLPPASLPSQRCYLALCRLENCPQSSGMCIFGCLFWHGNGVASTQPRHSASSPGRSTHGPGGVSNGMK